MKAALDPAIELLGIVDRLGAAAKTPLAGRARDYAASLERACAPFRSHPAVALNARLDESDLDFFQRKTLLLMRSAPPALEYDPALEASKGEAERSGAWEPWLAAMRDFARASRFAAAFGRAARILKPELDGLNARLARTDYAGLIERYTGLPYEGRYRVVFSPLCARGRHLNRVWTRDDGGHDIVSVLESDSVADAGPDGDDHSLDAVLWHELGHGVLDMTVNLHDCEQGNTPLSLGPRLGSNCRNWLHGMREHLVRAVMLRLIAQERGEKAAAKEYRLEEFSAKPHLGAFIELLKEYEASRKRCPNLAGFYPRLREVFPRAAAVKLAPPVDDGRDSFHDALRRLAGPFYTKAQRARAAAHLDLLLEKSPDERLLLRRAALNLLLEKPAATAKDAAVLAAGGKGDPVFAAWGAALLKKARTKP